MNQTGYAVAVERNQEVSKSSNTEIIRHSIEGHQKEIAGEIARLQDKLSLVLHPEPDANGTDKIQPPPPPGTAMHGWLCEQRDALRRSLDALKSLNSRIEV